MPEGDTSHAQRPGGRWLRRCTAGLVLVVLLAAAASYQFELGPRWFGFDYPSPVTEPSKVLPPPGLTLPEAKPAAAVAEAAGEQVADGDAVRRAVARIVRSKKLGKRVAVDVAQMSDGAVVYRYGASRVTPASTMKLLTATAALETLGPDHRFETTVVTRPGSKRVTLLGGGDPLLASAPVGNDDIYPARADLVTLARATAKALKAQGRSRVRLGYDVSLFTGPAVNPRWEPSYVPDNVVTRISSLWVDEGRDAYGFRSPDPAAAAAQVFARALEKRKINVVGQPASDVADTTAEEIAAVRSAPLAQVVQYILEVSDNEGAEVLARQVAVAEKQPASFIGASRAVRSVLGDLGIDTRGDLIYDGSGLSRQDRLRTQTLLSVIETAADQENPGLRSAVADLPVAGFTGSLTYRFDTGDQAGPGAVRAKTGTLSRVHGLAGTVTSRDGVVMSFVAIADRVRIRNTLTAQTLIDELAAALAGCTCAVTP